MSLLNVSHYRQRQQVDCLAACAAMLLTHLQLPVDYPRLVRLLGIRSYGAAFSNLRRLEALELFVAIDRGDLVTLRQTLDEGFPAGMAGA